MSDVDRSTSGLTTNIAMAHFEQFYPICDRRNRELANIYVSHADRNQPVFGTVYLMHGYGGSPVEPVMKVAMTDALACGFDVVAIEGVALSATSGDAKRVTTMNLARQKRALLRGIQYCNDRSDLNHDYRIAWAHSMSCRALSDLMVSSDLMRQYFHMAVLNNPYFLPPQRVQQAKAKLMQRDPSGRLWQSVLHKSITQFRRIEDREYSFPTSLYNLTMPLPTSWCMDTNLPDLSERLSTFIHSDTRVSFVLGTDDNMAEYSQNVELFNGLRVPHKELHSIDGANHSFENALDQYQTFTHRILDNVRHTRGNF
ncbi:hypothetical protein HDR63_02105 [bacterium]|nr:hypothetical protein [bacterium]